MQSGDSIGVSLETFRPFVPDSLRERSGKVFYSGSSAFSVTSPLYILGLNLGGCPVTQKTATVEANIKTTLERESPHWSAYRDESWRDKTPGTDTMQPRILHLLNGLGFEPHLVPASNLVFERTAREADLHGFKTLAELCWPFHKNVIEKLEIRVVLCLGRRCGDWVRRRVGATRPGEPFTEKNKRRWKTLVHSNEAGLHVITASHPSRADWTSHSSDPTTLVKGTLKRVGAASD